MNLRSSLLLLLTACCTLVLGSACEPPPPAVACSADADCGVAEVCEGGSCVAGEGEGEGEGEGLLIPCGVEVCEDPERCATSVPICGAPCARTGDCLVGQVCLEDACIASPGCTTSAECTADTVCRGGACVEVECDAENCPWSIAPLLKSNTYP